MTAIRAAILWLWAGLLYAVGFAAGLLITFALFSVAALYAGYLAGRGDGTVA